MPGLDSTPSADILSHARRLCRYPDAGASFLGPECHAGGCLDQMPWPIPWGLSIAATALVLIGFCVVAWKYGVRQSEGKETSGPGEKERVYFVDNCRFMLETLVIANHFMIYFAPQPLVWWMLGFHGYCESFFLHFFAFCSGLLSKGYLTPERAKRSVVRVLVPFLLLNTIVLPVAQQDWDKFKKVPSPYPAIDTTWFLQAWLVWRAVTPFLSTLKLPFMIFAAFFISWISGYWYHSEANKIFHADVAFAYLGFYIAGYAIPLASLISFDRTWIKLAGLGVTLVVLCFHLGLAGSSTSPVPCWVNGGSEPCVSDSYVFWDQYGVARANTTGLGHFDYRYHWDAWHTAASRHFYFKDDWVSESTPTLYWLAWTQRLSHQLLICVPTGLAFLAMVPHQELFFTEWGSRTMYPFVGQMFIIKLQSKALEAFMGPCHKPKSDELDTCHLPYMNAFLFFALMIAWSLAVNIGCACRFTHAWARYIMEPDWILGIFQTNDELAALYGSSYLPMNDKAHAIALLLESGEVQVVASDDECTGSDSTEETTENDSKRHRSTGGLHGSGAVPSSRLL